ncbi:hypothetical protein NEPAR04_0141 [Nematocida parisii]|nr:hypothetical protein NEPAR03_0135 [Nematocida parisii]KAI5125771.1 hypothetical protein NEPAR08_0209 [Nematocida parisii]KAI5140196.1 hypothetical protein NEPAR04_0141 [Nematocida parisii]
MQKSNKRHAVASVFTFGVIIALTLAEVLAKKDKTSTTNNVMITVQPSQISMFIWLAISKFVKLSSDICECFIAYNSIILALISREGYISMVAWSIQMVMHFIFCKDYKKNYNNLSSSYKKELNVLYGDVEPSGTKKEEAAEEIVDEYEIAFTNRKIPSESLLPSELTEEQSMDLDLEKSSEIGFISSGLMVIIKYIMQGVFCIALLKSVVFLASSIFIITDMQILNHAMIDSIYTYVPYGEALIGGTKSMLMALHGPTGTLLTGSLVFFGKAMEEYYKIFESNDEVERSENLHKKNWSYGAYLCIKSFFLFLIIKYRAYALIAFVDQLVWMILSKSFCDKIIRLIKGADLNVSEFREKQHKRQSHSWQKKIANVIRLIGVVVSISFLFYIIASFFGLSFASSLALPIKNSTLGTEIPKIKEQLVNSTVV